MLISENNVFDKLIVMDDVSALADKSDKFANFLTVSRKFSFTCVYVLHTMYPTRSSWRIILSQTKIFNIFTWCFNYNKKERVFNRFLAIRKKRLIEK